MVFGFPLVDKMVTILFGFQLEKQTFGQPGRFYNKKICLYKHVSWIIKSVFCNLSKLAVILSKSRKAHNNNQTFTITLMRGMFVTDWTDSSCSILTPSSPWQGLRLALMSTLCHHYTIEYILHSGSIQWIFTRYGTMPYML